MKGRGKEQDGQEKSQADLAASASPRGILELKCSLEFSFSRMTQPAFISRCTGPFLGG